MDKFWKDQTKSRGQYRQYRRKKGHGIIFAAFGTPLPGEVEGKPFVPPPGWHYFENQWGRGYSDPKPIPTPYDYGMTDADRIRLFPEWWRQHHRIEIARRRKALVKAVKKIRQRVRKGPGKSIKPVKGRKGSRATHGV